MRTKIFITGLLILIIAPKMFSQYLPEWIARYDLQSSFDYPNCVTTDRFGNCYVTGYSANRYLTIKYNHSGNQIWTARYNKNYPIPDDYASSIVVDSYSNVYVTGQSKGPTFFYMDYATVKYDSNGNQLWVRIYNSIYDNHDRATAMALDKNGNAIVTGNSVTYDTVGNFSYNTLKYNSDGDELWISRYYGFTSYILGGVPPSAALVIDSSNNIIIAGFTYEPITVSPYNIIIKYSTNGEQLWIRETPGTGEYSFFSIACDKSDNVYFANQNNLIKYNSIGDSLWSNQHMVTFIKKIAVDNSGNVFVAGSRYPNGFTTIKYDSIGTQMWMVIDTIGRELSSMVIDYNGNIFETGTSCINGNCDYYTLIYNTSGNKIWSYAYNGPLDSMDIARDIALDENGNVYVTGQSKGIGTSFDYATIKYSIVTNLNNNTYTNAKGFKLHQNFPNPFNPITKINFSIPAIQYTILKVYDALGREVKTLVNQMLSPGSYETEFDGSDFSSGVYFYKIEAGDFTETNRMILLK